MSLTMQLTPGDAEDGEIPKNDELVVIEGRTPSEFFEAKDRYENEKNEKISRDTFRRNIEEAVYGFQYALKQLLLRLEKIKECQLEVLRRKQMGTEEMARSLPERKGREGRQKVLQRRMKAVEAITLGLIGESKFHARELGLIAMLEQNPEIIEIDSIKLRDLSPELLERRLSSAKELGYLHDRNEFLSLTFKEAQEVLEDLKIRIIELSNESVYNIRSETREKVTEAV